MKLYKLTDRDGYTRRGEVGETRWRVGVAHTAQGEGEKLCTPGVIHAYRDPWLGLFLNPAHANISHPRLWEAEGEVVAEDWGKVEVKRLEIRREIEYIPPTVEQRVRFAIRCAWSGANEEWRVWARTWLSGEDRSKGAAEAAEAAAAAWARAWAAEAAAWAWTAEAAAEAAEAAAEAAAARAGEAEAAAWAGAAASGAAAGAAEYIQYAQWAMGKEVEISE